MKRIAWTTLVVTAAVVAVSLAPTVASAQGVLNVVDNKVGIGTDTPATVLEVVGAGGEVALINGGAAVVRRTDASPNIRFDNGAQSYLFQNGQTDGIFSIRDETVGRTPLGIYPGNPSLTLILRNGRLGLQNGNPAHPIHALSGAYLSAGGVWTNASSRAYKEDISELSATEALEALSGMQPVLYRYKNTDGERHVGFIAEDVPELVATQDRKGLSSMDVVAVLTKVVQEQQATIERLENRLAGLEAE